MNDYRVIIRMYMYAERPVIGSVCLAVHDREKTNFISPQTPTRIAPVMRSVSPAALLNKS